ncbi:unnamed protein product [Microthlaspi erraticum]|uniref:Endonuclease/exonuclease/phosphatase domain-containing protein n=1 Tax=Microthlaspi erraticum TaxID=1685480 RepID=A0A6D2IZR3_9BRAS|nr:unnamed protein product [Microthlaspi erraticum]
MAKTGAGDKDEILVSPSKFLVLSAEGKVEEEDTDVEDDKQSEKEEEEELEDGEIDGTVKTKRTEKLEKPEVKETRAPKLAPSVLDDYSVIMNYEFSHLGRIWVVWRSNVRVTPFFKSGQMITCSIKIEGNDDEFFCSFVYASNFVDERKELWSDIRDHYDSPILRNKPWLIFGDFNEILDGEEHSSFENDPSTTTGMRDFQDLVRDCSLSDMASHGPLFTWSNKREHGLISKKLDRVLMNEHWPRSFPLSYSVFEAGGISDHLRCRIHLTLEIAPARKPFKFVNVVAELDSFLPVVDEYWKSTTPIFLSTSAMHRFTKKLKGLKPLIRTLAKEKMGNLSKKAKEAHEELCIAQEQSLLNPTSQNMEAEKIAFRRWENISVVEEKYLKQKSKLHWLKVGDRNNKYFHKGIEERRAHNTIREILCRDGQTATSGDAIKHEAEGFFREFLQYTPADYEGITIDSLQDLLPRCRDEDHAMLVRVVSAEEIKGVLFAMPNDKSPGPDGFTTEFFKKAWSPGHFGFWDGN